MNFRKKYFFFSTAMYLVLFALSLNAQTLYWLDASFSAPSLGRCAADGSNIHTTALGTSSLPEGLAYSTVDSKILWTELQFVGAGIHGTDSSLVTASTIVSNSSALRGIAVDDDNNWIYYATSNLQSKPKIGRIHPNGTGNETVLLLDSITGNPRALALDAAARHLYWTEFTEGAIKRIDLDGSASPQTIVSGLNGPVGLAVNHNAGKLFWAEANGNTISRSDLNGFSTTVILSGLATPNYLTVDTAGGFVYWTEIGIPRIRKATVAGGSIETLPITVSHPAGIRFVSQYEEALPVELAAFIATSRQNTVEVHWSTATEVNNHGFQIEKLSNYKITQLRNSSWEAIGFIPGHGSTNAPKEYSFSDNNLQPGKYSYRLKQIDRDGKFEYSKEVEVTVGSAPLKFELAQNYPNPFNPSTNIGVQLPAASHVSLKIFDAIGREVAVLVNEVKEAGNYSVAFDGSKLSSGMYFARLSSADKVQTKIMLLVK